MRRQILLVGTPNVGKSLIFNYLTGRYVHVSNYPGTTVEVARGVCRLGSGMHEVVDTPGIYSLLPLTDEERVTREFLFQGKPDVVVHVAAAADIRRMLNLTLELLDAGLPVILDLNLMDEAAAAGIRINRKALSDALGIPVVTTSAVKKIGLEMLKSEIDLYRPQGAVATEFSFIIERALAAVSSKLAGKYGVSKRMIALLLLQGDQTVLSLVSGEPAYREILADIRAAAAEYPQPLARVIAYERQAMVDKLLDRAVSIGKRHRPVFAGYLDRLTRKPLTGIPILALVLYFGLYKFVGGFGAGFLVDYINQQLFARMICPAVKDAAELYLPWDWLVSLLVGEYGLFNLGLRYAVAIILPVTGTFFLVLAVLEDCGYLPRLAMLMDGLFKKIGLNGRAVIPVILGLGCGTMAVIVARTLETKRERLLATFLLALAVPCSAQLGVIMALLSHDWRLITIWGAYVLAVFIVSGWLGAKVLPGKRSPFYMELPPLRLPTIGNVLTKAYSRMVWYFAEIFPVFLFASFFMWLGDRLGALAYIIKMMEPLMQLLELPPKAAEVFLIGFFRRDYGAAGLYDMCAGGLLDGSQLLVAAVTLTLFVPCVAQLMIMIKERGGFATLIMMLLITAVAFGSGWFVLRLSSILI